MTVGTVTSKRTVSNLNIFFACYLSLLSLSLNKNYVIDLSDGWDGDQSQNYLPCVVKVSLLSLFLPRNDVFTGTQAFLVEHLVSRRKDTQKMMDKAVKENRMISTFEGRIRMGIGSVILLAGIYNFVQTKNYGSLSVRLFSILRSFPH